MVVGPPPRTYGSLGPPSEAPLAHHQGGHDRGSPAHRLASAVVVLVVLAVLGVDTAARRDKGAGSLMTGLALDGAVQANMWDEACAAAAVAACGSSSDAPALAGTDVVEYFRTQGAAATPGSPAYAASHGTAVYYFASQDNLEAFAAAPETYAPQLGGFCAYQLSGADLGSHDTVLCTVALDTVDPDVWTLYDGKLYLFKGDTALDAMLSGDVQANFDAAHIAWNALQLAPGFVNSNSDTCLAQVAAAWIALAKEQNADDALGAMAVSTTGPALLASGRPALVTESRTSPRR